VYRKSHSWASLRFYESGVRRLDFYCKERHGICLEEMITNIKEGKHDVYSFLDGFASWMDAKGLKGKT
jgi:hypothetical protein